MDELTQEAVIDVLDGLYMWPAAKPGWTLFGSRLGRLMLTGERLMFLSTGANIGMELIFATFFGPLAGLSRKTTDHLDVSALTNDGSLSGRLEHITSTRVARSWLMGSYLVVETAGTRSLPPACSFMTRYGWGRDRMLAFRQNLESTRAVAPRRQTLHPGR
jgi:hypothetical protein